MVAAPGTDKRNGRWWMLVVASRFGMEFLQQGFFKSTGVLLPSLVLYYNTDYATMGLILSLEYCSYFLSSPFWQALSKWVNRRTIVTVGGLGTGLSLVCTNFSQSHWTLGLLFFLSGFFGAAGNQTSYVALREHCRENFASATAFALLGTFAGGLTMPLLTAKLHETYGLKGALLIVGGMFLHFVPFGLILRKPRSAMQGDLPTESTDMEMLNVEADDDVTETREMLSTEERSESGGYCDVRERNSDPQKDVEHPSENVCLQVLRLLSNSFDLNIIWEERSVMFTLLPSLFLMKNCFVGWVLFQVSYAISVGVDEDWAVYLPLADAAAGLVGRVVIVIIFCFKPDSGLIILTVSEIISVIALAIFPLSSSYYYLLACSCLSGVGLFGIFPSFYSTLGTVLPENHFSAVVTYALFTTGLGVAAAGPVTGKIFDVTGSFAAAFRVLAGIMALALSLTITFCCGRRRRTTCHRTDDHDIEHSLTQDVT